MCILTSGLLIYNIMRVSKNIQ